MSEYTPITGELRAAMRQYGWVESDGSITFATTPLPPSIDVEQSLAISGSDFERLCDAIDAVHAQLERENASLKAELDRVLGEQEDRRSCIYYDPERHYCSCHDIDTDGLVRLPVDADKVPINIGDVMVYADGNTCPLHVVALVPPAVFLTDDGPRYADMCRHAPDTWERIIEDARTCTGSAGNYTTVPSMRWTNEVDALVARCKALCERTKEDA